MKYFKIKQENGTIQIVQAKNSLELIKKYDLATKKHIKTRVIELEGEMSALEHIKKWFDGYDIE